MPQFILLSFCNIPTQTTSPLLCLLVPDKLEDPICFAPVSLGYPDLTYTATGLTLANDKIFVLFKASSNKIYVAALQKGNLSPIYYQELPEVKDGHSILAINDCLYVVSTGTDEVVCYDILERSLENPRTIWCASDTKTDTHHINSIVEKNGEILVSAFGPKAGQLWSTASNGYIYNITTNSLVIEGIYHPHSLNVWDGKIYYSDSHRNSLCVVGQKNAIFDLYGYTRGVSWLANDLVCMATSIGRRISKSTGLIANSADPGEPAGECSLLLGNVSEQKILGKIDLAWFGPEIYDVLVLQELRIDLLALANISQRSERHVLQILLQQLNESNQQVVENKQQLAEVKQQLQMLTVQVAERDTQLANLESQITAMYASFSWQITAPIRTLGTKLRQISGHSGTSDVDLPDVDKS